MQAVTYATGVILLDVGLGNVGSVVNVLKHIAPQLPITVAPHADAAAAASYSHVILPGVGAFDAYLTRLYERGFNNVINTSCVENTKPLLGICLGMHALANTSDEVPPSSQQTGMGLITGHIAKIIPDTNQRLPHVGWNSVFASTRPQHPLLANLPDHTDFYYTHSYTAHPQNSGHVLATTPYSTNHRLTAIMGANNIVGTQFHPEKSGPAGMQLLTNFLNWDSTFTADAAKAEPMEASC